jgi:DNA-binding MarR family transcriptional regulator
MAMAHTEALDLVLELTVLLNEDATQALARHGLTPVRAHLAWELHHRGAATQRTIADWLGVTPRNVTGLVDAMVDIAFVTREPHPRDRRATLVTLTPHGASVMAAMDRDHQALAELLFGDMPQFDAFAAGLAHVTSRLKEALGR